MSNTPKQRWRVRPSPLCPGKLDVFFFQIGRGWAHYAFVRTDDWPAWCEARDIYPLPVLESEAL